MWGFFFFNYKSPYSSDHTQGHRDIVTQGHFPTYGTVLNMKLSPAKQPGGLCSVDHPDILETSVSKDHSASRALLPAPSSSSSPSSPAGGWFGESLRAWTSKGGAVG